MDQTLILNKILEQQNLNIEESMYIFNKIMSGELDDIKITSILIGLKLKGETKEEIIGRLVGSEMCIRDRIYLMCLSYLHPYHKYQLYFAESLFLEISLSLL